MAVTLRREGRQKPPLVSFPTLIHPTNSHIQDVLKYYGATKYGAGPPALGCRSPRESFNPAGAAFLRERGTYQDPVAHP